VKRLLDVFAIWVSDKENIFAEEIAQLARAKADQANQSDEASGARSSKVVIARLSRSKDGVASAPMTARPSQVG
jgi:hypothetical protein